MAEDLLALVVGGVDRSDPISSYASVASTKHKQDTGPAFAAQLASASPVGPPSNVASELSAAKKFEAVFVAQMMTSILPEDSEYFGEGFAGDAWRSMMSEQLANVAVKQTDFGIASLIDQGFANRSDANSSMPRGETNLNKDLLNALSEE